MGHADQAGCATPQRPGDSAEEAFSGITIFIRDLSVRTIIGVHEHERRQPQLILMDLGIELDANPAGDTDHLVDTVDYAEVVSDVRELLAGESFFLLERLAELVAVRILDEFGARRVSVMVAKVGILEDIGRVGVKISRRAPASVRGMRR